MKSHQESFQKQVEDLRSAVHELTDAVKELSQDQVKPYSCRPLSLEEAAKYTGRSRRTFQKECREGIWTSIRIKGTGHPKFLTKDLDQDMEAWKQLGSFRRGRK